MSADIGKRVRQARGDMTQNELREKVGLKTLMAISNIETGVTKNPKTETLQRIAEATGTTLEWLLHGDRPAAEESRVERDADEGHPVVEEFIEDNRGDLSEDEVARLRRNFYRGADEDFVREHLPKYLLSMRRAPKVEDRGEVAKAIVRAGARRMPQKAPRGPS